MIHFMGFWFNHLYLRTWMKNLLQIWSTQGKMLMDSTQRTLVELYKAAERQREDSEAKLKEYDDIVLKSKLEAKNIYKNIRDKTQNKSEPASKATLVNQSVV